MAVFIVFSFSKGTKKSKMKLGIPSKKSSLSSESQPIPAHPASRQPTAPTLLHSDNQLNLEIIGQKTETNAQYTTLKDDDLELAAGQQRVNSAKAVSAPRKDEELIRLLRNRQTGRLIVEVAGEQYSKLAEISDQEIGQYVLEITAHLLAFTNGTVISRSGLKTYSVPQTNILPQPVASNRATDIAISSAFPLPPTSTPTDAEAALLSSLKKNLSGAEAKPQKSGLFGVVNPVSQPSNLPVLNLADEINEIVQDRLRSSPLEKDNQISITSDPSGGIRIKVNNRHYRSPDEIPDLAVRDLIKSSIKEWERR